MRNIFFTKKFKKQYKKLTNDLQKKAKFTLIELETNPFPDSLKVHKLHGKLF